MTSVRPPRAAAPFAPSSWDTSEADEDDPDLPPALSPGLAKKAPVEDRATIQPPVPPGEYVAQMMELGEIDDPSEDGDFARPASPRPRRVNAIPKSPPLAKGLVMAPEREMLFDDHAEVGITDPVEIEQRRNAATAPVRPRVETPAPFARVGGALPVPRAPSVHPDDDVTEPGELWFEESHPVVEMPRPNPRPPVRGTPTPNRPIARATPQPNRPVATPARMTPQPARPPAGLRLGKTRAAPAPAPVAPLEIEPPVSEPPPVSAVDRLREMEALFETNNYSSALVMAESVLVSDPGNTAAQICAEACRDNLAKKYLDRLGGRAGIPRVVTPPEEMRWLSLDHRAGFLVSTIDGSMSIDELLDVCSMPALDALRIMFDLREQGVIEIAEPRRRRR